MQLQLALDQPFGLACRPSDTTSNFTCRFEVDRGDNLAAVLFEQLGDLIEYSEQERDRLGQVVKILMAPFGEGSFDLTGTPAASSLPGSSVR